MSVEDRIRSIVAEKLGVEESNLQLSSQLMTDLGADSLDILELTVAIEEAFNIVIPDEDQDQLTTVGDLVNYVEQKHK